MTGLSLILVLAPWIVFGALLAIVCTLLFRSHRMSRPAAAPQSRPCRPNPKEERCPDQNAGHSPR